METSQVVNLQEKCIDKKWLDLRVFYVRMSSCPLQRCPQFLSLYLLPRDFSVGLEVNGEHIAPSEIVASVLQRDRIDEESDEVTYVSTDSVKTTGLLRFEVYYKDALVVCGKLERLYTGIEDFEKNKELEWSMDCSAAFRLVDWVFLRSSELRPSSDSAPMMEVYVAGCSFERPVIFTKRLQLAGRRNVGGRKGAGRPCLVAITEDEEIEKPCESRVRRDALFQLTDCSDNEDLDENFRPAFHDYDPSSDYTEDENGDIYWFNTGVNVGVGIGLGLCLAIGIGVGLLVSTYQIATKASKRRWL